MFHTAIREDSSWVTIATQPAFNLTDDQFFDFCQLNPDLRLERNAKGDIIIMPPAGGVTSWRNSEIVIALGNWAKKDGRGVVFDSSGGFNLPKGGTRAPDAAWVKKSKLATLTPAEKSKFPPICPNFVIELRSRTDRLRDLQDKMEEYVANGIELGWLIDPEARKVHIYRPDRPIEVLENPTAVSGEDVLPGFVLNVTELWEPNF